MSRNEEMFRVFRAEALEQGHALNMKAVCRAVLLLPEHLLDSQVRVRTPDQG
jgi:hypothetical protein